MLRYFFRFLSKKLWLVALLGALFVSAVYGLPHILISQNLALEGLRYVPITVFSDGDEAQIYAPRIADVVAGDYRVGDPALVEYKNAVSPLPPAGSMVLGTLARVTSVENFWIVIDFILPPLLFLLFFAVARLITGSTAVALLASGFLIFFRGIASLPPFSSFHQFKVWAAHFNPFVPDAVNTRLSFDRIESPEWTFLPLGIFLLLWLLSLKKERLLLSVLTGLAYGALFYTYPYDWITVSVALGIFLVLCIVSKLLKSDFNSLGQVAVTIGVGLFISIPYWINFFEVSALPQYQEILVRTGLEVGHFFRWQLWPQYVLWLVSAVLLWIRAGNALSYAAISFFLSAVVVLNVQMISGYVPQPEHFLRYPLSFTLWAAFLILGVSLWNCFQRHTERLRKYLLFGAAVILAVVVVRSVQLQIAYADQNSWRYTLDEPLYESFAWMREHVSDKEVVLSPSFVTNTHLLIFTPVKVFVPPTGLITTAPNQELVERYVIAAKFFGASDEYIKERFSREFLTGGGRSTEDVAALHLYHYGLYEQAPHTYFTGQSVRPMHDVENMVAGILEQWHESHEILLQKYLFQYIYVGPDEQALFPEGLSETNLCIEKVYQNSKVALYKRCLEDLPKN